MLQITLLTLTFISGQLIALDPCCGARATLLDIIVVLVVGYHLVKTRFHIERKFLKAILPFISVGLLSLIFHIPQIGFSNIILSSLYLIRFLSYALLIQVAAEIPNKRLVLLSLYIGGFTIAIIGLIQYFIYPNLRNLEYLGWDPHQYRVFSTLLDPNFTGILLLLTFILGIYISIQLSGKMKFFYYASLLVVGMSFMLTYSRGSYFAFLVTLFVWFTIKRKVSIVLLGIILFSSALLVLPKPAGEGVNLLRMLSIRSRLENTQEAWRLFQSSPLFGVGFNTVAYRRSDRVQLTQRGYRGHSLAGFHNSYAFILATTGIIGFMTYIWLWKTFLWEKVPQMFEKSTRLIDDQTLKILTFVALFTHSFFDLSLFYPQIMYWIFILIGVMDTIKVNK